MKYLKIAFTALVYLSISTWAQSASSQTTFLSEARTITANSSFTVAIQLKHPENWHSYYHNSGGVEKSLELQWQLPDGFHAGPLQWPTPTVKDGYFGKSFIFSGSPIFLVKITAPPNLEIGTLVNLTAHATWQICEQLCINEESTFTLSIPVGESLVLNVDNAPWFELARSQQPRIAADWQLSAQTDSQHVLLRLTPHPPLASPPTDFIPDQPFAKSLSSGGSITQDGGSWLVRLPIAKEDALGSPLTQGDSISGILLGEASFAIPTTKIETSAPTRTKSKVVTALSFAALLPILGGMFLGGLILNLMPCVFPVIGLKIMGFVQQAGSDRKKIILHGVTFTLGVLASFGVISGILFAARSASNSTEIGWGYQLQNPWIVLTLMLLMFVLALNMFGIFEIGAKATSVGGSLQSKQGISGSFFSGVLATVVATPCSAPFLGTAIGIAIGLPAFQFFSAFAAMALGLSTPYLILSSFPKLIDYLPRPGAWMESFKQGMSFLLFATAGYLLWVYAGQIDLDHLLGPIFGLSMIAIAAWIYGRWNLPHLSRRTRSTALILSIAFALAGLYLAKPPQKSALTWEPWTQNKVDAALASGQPVYIDFTAKWCATCQANKLRAYTPEVVAMLQKKNVVTFKADKTKPNPEIEKALQQLGRSAIPVNVLIAPGKDPIILPELLSPKDVIMALESL